MSHCAPAVVVSSTWLVHRFDCHNCCAAVGAWWQQKVLQVIGGRHADLITPYCNTHDMCYATPGSAKDVCDRTLVDSTSCLCDSLYGHDQAFDILSIFQDGNPYMLPLPEGYSLRDQCQHLVVALAFAFLAPYVCTLILLRFVSALTDVQLGCRMSNHVATLSVLLSPADPCCVACMQDVDQCIRQGTAGHSQICQQLHGCQC